MSPFHPAFENDKGEAPAQDHKRPALPTLGDNDLEQVKAAGDAMSGQQRSGRRLVIIRDDSPPVPDRTLPEVPTKGMPPIPGKQLPAAELTPEQQEAINEKRMQELTGKLRRDGKLLPKEQLELEDLSDEKDLSREEKLKDQRRKGHISREDNIWLAAREQFGSGWQKEACDLAVQELSGTISDSGRARLAAWREFGGRGQSAARDLATREFLHTLDPKGAARLAAWREFPPDEFARARDLATRAGMGEKLSEKDAKELAEWREQPRMPIWAGPVGNEDDNSTSHSGSKNFGKIPENPEEKRKTKRADDNDKLAKSEFPDDPHGQELVRLYLNGKLNRAQAAELAGLREAGDDREYRKLVEEERLGTITPEHKAALLARREFNDPDPNSVKARPLAAAQLMGTIDAAGEAELAARREFSSNIAGFPVKAPDGTLEWKDAIELAKLDYLHRLRPDQVPLLQKVREQYKAACDAAVPVPDAPPPPPPEPAGGGGSPGTIPKPDPA